jgi:hypothetical protein
MNKYINNFFNFLNSFTIDIDIGKNLNATFELNRNITENFSKTDRYGYSFFVNEESKYYQQVIDSDLIPAFIYQNKKYKYKDFKIQPRFLKEYNANTKYKLGDIVTWKKQYYINLVLPQEKTSGNITFSTYSQNITPVKKFGDYTVWKKINYYKSPIKFKKSELYADNLPPDLKIGQVLDDSNPENLIKVSWKDEYDSFTEYSLGNIVTLNKKGYINLSLKPMIQESPKTNKTTWKPVIMDLPPDYTAYVISKLLPDSIIDGKYILPSSVPNNIRELYKAKIVGPYKSDNTYKLGDIVLYKDSYYLNLLKDIPYYADPPTSSKQQWKEVRILNKDKKSDTKETDTEENVDENSEENENE